MSRMSRPLRTSTWTVDAMSSCNALPVIMEISPTTTAGCIEKRSCNASGNGIVSAVSQNQPLKVEIKGFKTSHFLEQKTAPRNSPDAGPMEHVELPKSEPANNYLQFTRPRLAPTTNRTRAWDRSRDRRPISAVSKTSHFDHRS